jgi:hypothetical protein
VQQVGAVLVDEVVEIALPEAVPEVVGDRGEPGQGAPLSAARADRRPDGPNPTMGPDRRAYVEGRSFPVFGAATPEEGRGQTDRSVLVFSSGGSPAADRSTPPLRSTKTARTVSPTDVTVPNQIPLS